MTTTVHEDLLAGASFSLGPAGPSATRVFVVESDTAITPRAAIEATGIPLYGDAYPDIGSTYFDVFAYEFTCTPLDDNRKYQVVVNYSRPEPNQQTASTDPDDCIIQIGSSVSAGKTQKDNTGTQISVTLTDQPAQVGDVDIQIPETVISFERREGSSPLTKAAAYTGYVNSISVTGFGARTLLCLGIDGNSSDGGTTWVVTYRFQYKVETWDAQIVYIDPETDRPHADVNIAGLDGFTVVEIYPTADFNNLDLPW